MPWQHLAYFKMTKKFQCLLNLLGQLKDNSKLLQEVCLGASKLRFSRLNLKEEDYLVNNNKAPCLVNNLSKR